MVSTKKKDHQYLSLMIEKKTVKDLNALAKQLDMSRSALVRRGIDLLFERVDTLVADGNSSDGRKT